MKNVVNLFMVVVLAFVLTACSGISNKNETLPSEITMENLDQVVGDVTIIDLRNLEDKFSSGYIKKTELVPFFEILEAQGIVVRGEDATGKKSWNADLAVVDPDFRFDAIFPRDETIVLFCAGGTRSGFMKDILVTQGYDEDLVHNAGAFKDYEGNYLVEATIDIE